MTMAKPHYKVEYYINNQWGVRFNYPKRIKKLYSAYAIQHVLWGVEAITRIEIWYYDAKGYGSLVDVMERPIGEGPTRQ